MEWAMVRNLKKTIGIFFSVLGLIVILISIISPIPLCYGYLPCQGIAACAAERACLVNSPFYTTLIEMGTGVILLLIGLFLIKAHK